MIELRRLWNVLRSHAKAYAGSPRFVTVHNKDGFENEGHNYQRTMQIFKNAQL